ncbi:MAG: 3-deoxy-manno-octulosonate cytidylyltransferase [Candidatus Omnitrophota bacterium]
MKVIGVIPARLNSQRLKNKVLKPICGKPLLWYTWQGAKKASLLDRVIIACCDKEVEEAALKFGAEVFPTDPNHKSGTDRIAEVAAGIDCDIILNIQGDEPLIKGETLDAVARVLIDNPDEVMASAAFGMTEKETLENENVVKVVLDNNGYALYFSRSLIPYQLNKEENVKYFKHIGIYAYKKDFLLKFSKMPQTPLEKIERLEQLRVIENSFKIRIIETDRDSVGVDTEEDFKKVEKVINDNFVGFRHA